MRSFYLLLALLLVANYGFAQEKQQTKTDEAPKKVIIVKKSVGADGKETIERIVRDGTDEQPLELNDEHGKVIIKELGGDQLKSYQVIIDSDQETTIDLKREVNVNVENVNGEREVRVRLRPENGEEKVIEWKGTGEIPVEIREELELEGVQVHELKDGENGDQGVFFFKKGEEDQEFEWNTVEPSGAFLGIMSKQDVEVEVVVDENGQESVTKSPESEVNGVVVGEVIEGSAAAEAGLQEGDILHAMDGKPLENFSDLLEFMQDTEVGQQINIAYERNGSQLQTTATLKEREDGLTRIMLDKETRTSKSGDSKVFFYTKSDEDTKIHTRHHIVVITRGDKSEETENAVEPELPTVTLQESELPRNLQLREYSLFPNPTDGKLRLKFAGEALPTVVRINDLNGKQLYRERLNKFDGNYDQNIDLSDLPAGLLLLTIEQNGKVYTEQIVLK